MKAISVEQAFRALAKYELTASIAGPLDDVFRVRLLDETFGAVAERKFQIDELESIGIWLLDVAAKHKGRRSLWKPLR